ncbi:hypothetical protein PARSHIK_145 [Erwinia phage vB_EamM_Parshik]|uniref:Uncharacterized protein n=1 Tax=Erwinia phage vB_EamM_Huxley TaxID=1883373 RepID=A0A1B2ID74_9CAUD|nr:hypothetical protein BIZ81_gp139 [Erwinia phage vB_EamM_Huxley]ANZ49226.1 hypothetical protein HUXLEY_144 [Erwinia phage vB_EamM_Huxley]ANZ50054.1 hypothetical protein PARSHIK_145 [Erwinia phage vB_EamM_Parshik]
MLKPKKRKDRVYLMRATNGGYVVRSETKRRALTQDAIDGILLVYSPEYSYPCANRVVRLVLDMVYRNNRKKVMLKEFSWETFTPSPEKFRVPTDGVMGRELDWSRLLTKPVISENAKAAIGGLEIKGVQLKQSKLKTDDIQELVKEFGVVAEQQLIDRFMRNEQPTQEEYEQAQAIGRLMLHRWLEKQNC